MEEVGLYLSSSRGKKKKGAPRGSVLEEEKRKKKGGVLDKEERAVKVRQPHSVGKRGLLRSRRKKSHFQEKKGGGVKKPVGWAPGFRRRDPITCSN